MNGKRMPEQSGVFLFLLCRQLLTFGGVVTPERHMKKDDEHWDSFLGLSPQS